MRILHTMIRVVDLEKSIKFYENVFEMQVIKRKDYPDGKFTLVFIGYGLEEENTLIELTYNWDVTSYELGTAFGHIAIEVQEIDEICARAKNYGGKVVREPGPMKFGGSVIAFLEDPDGYKVELIERKSEFAKMYTRFEFGVT